MFFPIILCALLALATASPRDENADALCTSLLRSQLVKDKWPFEDDCHKYYLCSFTDREGIEITGKLKTCPPEHFFNYDVQSCIPEGPVPCRDKCTDKMINKHGCFALEKSCSTFFTCHNHKSQAACCPEGSFFDESTCQCHVDESCRDSCIVTSYGYLYGELEAEVEHEVDENFVEPESSKPGECIDSFGNALLPDETNVRVFYFYDGSEKVKMQCSPSTHFNIETCRCEQLINEESTNAACFAYFPFDEDFVDHSFSRLTGNIIEKVTLDAQRSVYGSASARIHGGHSRVIYEGFKKFDFGNEASFCFFYQCDHSPNNPLHCLGKGTLLTALPTTLDGNCELEYSLSASNRFGSITAFEGMAEAILARGPKVEARTSQGRHGFQQVCLVYSGNDTKLYVNKELHSTYESSGHLKLNKCSLNVGFGPAHGAFVGNIDELLLCRKALTPQQVIAHYQGPRAMRYAKVIPTTEPKNLPPTF